MDKIKVMSVFGTRPEAIKMAPLVKELEKTPEIERSIEKCWIRFWKFLTCTPSMT